jgi:hypothetical protein
LIFDFSQKFSSYNNPNPNFFFRIWIQPKHSDYFGFGSTQHCSKVLFRVALTLLKLNETRLLGRTEFSDLVEEVKAVAGTSREVLHCHEFLASMYAAAALPAGLTRAKLARLRAELGEEVREEELERERRRKADAASTTLRDG